MTKKMLFYFCLTLVLANMFYKESWGLNALITAFIIPVCYALLDFKTIRQPKSILAGSLLLINGVAIFFTGSVLSILLFFFSFFYFTSVQHNIRLSLPLGITQAFQAFFSGFYYMAETFTTHFKKKEGKDGKQIVIRVLLFTIPLIIFIVFLKLYQSADETFYELTKFINLDWISWGFLAFYFLLLLFCFGLFFFHGNEDIDLFESRLKNDISNSYTDKIQNFLGIQNESKIALTVLITLNALLLLYNFIDLKFIFIDLPNPEPTLRYSDLLHGGVNSLITSIVLVIFIITFLFRGQLNFEKNKITRFLALIWLIQNLIMVCTTSVKNFEYITHWGLTYKRIGVYIYLILAAVGLILTIIKILRVQSIWYLIRSTSIAFFICFSVMGTVNWNKLIANYNLTQLKEEQIDFEYLFSLGSDTYPQLMQYHHDHQISNSDLQYRLFHAFDSARDKLKKKRSTTTWRSLVLRERNLLSDMQRFNLEYTPDPYYETRLQ